MSWGRYNRVSKKGSEKRKNGIVVTFSSRRDARKKGAAQEPKCGTAKPLLVPGSESDLDLARQLGSRGQGWCFSSLSPECGGLIGGAS